MNNSKYRDQNEDPESEGSYSISGLPIPDPIGPYVVGGEDIQCIRDESMSSAFVDSFFLPGGIFELDEDLVEEGSPRRVAIDSSPEYIARNREGSHTISHNSRATYEFDKAVIASNMTKDAIDRRFDGYSMVEDQASKNTSQQSRTLGTAEHATLSMESIHRHSLFESRPPVAHPGMDFFQHSMDMIADARSSKGPGATLAAHASHSNGEAEKIPLNNLFSSIHNQETLQPSLISSTSIMNAGNAPQNINSFEESCFRQNLQYQHQNNWREVGSPIPPRVQDNVINFSSSSRNLQTHQGFVSLNPWRNSTVLQQGCIAGPNQVGVQGFQYFGHSPPDHSEYFSDNTVPMISSTAARPMPSHHPVFFQDPRQLGQNITYVQSATEPNECAAQLIPKNSSWQQRLVNESRSHVQNVAYNPSSTSFMGTPSMTVTTNTTTTVIPHSTRAPPGFAPPSQHYHPSLSPGVALPIAYEQHHDAPTLMMRKIGSFHAMEHQESGNVIFNSRESEGSCLPVQQSMQIQKMHQQEQDSRNKRDRDLDSQSSRGGVPSTIYLRADDDEDGISFSEETLTACADSVAEYDREYLRRVAISRKESHRHLMNVEQIIEDEGYNLTHESNNCSQKDGLEREQQIIDAPNAEDDEDDEEDELIVFAEGNIEEKIRKNGKTEEPIKKPKRKKKKIKKGCSESVSSRDISHGITSNFKEPQMPQNGDIIRSPNMEINATFSSAIEANNVRSEKVRHFKGARVKSVQSPNYISRQQKLNGLMDDIASTPKAAPMHESLMDICGNYRRMFLPTILMALKFVYVSSCSTMKDVVRGSTILLPCWERLWFILPVFCFISDFSFLLLCAISSIIGKIAYWILLAHKLALMEISDNMTLVKCYALTSSFPIAAGYILEVFPSLPSGSLLVMWYTIVRFILSPMVMEGTFLYRARNNTVNETASTRTMYSAASVLSIRPNMFLASRGKIQTQLSERLRITNQFLLTLRYMIPVFMLVECVSTGYGFISAMSLQERILLGFGLTVIRMGYIFVPIVFASWTLQLLLILLFPLKSLQVYFLLLGGLSCIRLSHFATAIEDMKMKPLNR